MKKVLSIMLAVAIICSLFAMPVWAAGDVYVADFDFATSNKSATGIALASGRSPHPYITGNVLNGASTCGWIEATINVTNEGEYTPTLTWWANGESYRNFYPWIYVDGVLIWSDMITDNTTQVGHPENVASKLEDAMLSSFRPCFLSEGEHTVRILCGNGYPTVDKITFTKITSDKVTAFADAPGFDAVKSRGVTLGVGNNGYVATVADGGAVYVEVIVPETGTYNVGAVIDKGNGSVDIAIAANETEVADVIAGVPGAGWRTVPLRGQLELNKGKNELYISVSGASLALDGIILEKLDEFEVDSVNSSMGIIEDGSTVKRGMDFFEIVFNYALGDDAVAENVALVKTEDSAPVAVEVETIVDKVVVKLKETLDFETDYTLTVSGIKDEYDRELTETTLTFVTGTADEDAGDGTITINESETIIVDNTATVKGTVKSSAGVGIAGRCVQVVATSPTEQEVYTSEAVLTGENGEFAVIFDLDENGESGEYTFVVSDEYAQAEPFKKLYVSNEAKNAILDGIFESDATNDVETVFEDYGFALGVDYPNDLSVLNDGDDELFLKHFVGLEYDTVDDVRADYDLWLMFETLNQTRVGGTVQQILESEENCAALGLDKTAIDLIEDYGIYFCEAVAALPKQESLEAFKAEFEVVLNDYFAVEMGKLDAILDVEDVSGKMGQGVDFEIAFDEKLGDVSEIILDITTDSDSVDLKNIDVSLELDGTYKTEKIDDGISIEIKADEVLNVKDIVTLLVTVPSESGRHDIDISGMVTYLYDKDGYSRAYTNGITEKTVVLTAKAASTNGGGGGGNSSSRPAGGSVAGSPINIGTSNPVVNTKFEFTDLASVQWAKESIDALLEKGVISESADKKFNPDRNVTREEFVKMIVVALGVYDKNAVSALVDVDGNEWYAPYIASAEKAGLITGDENGRFGVGEEISRQDMAVIVHRAMKEAAKTGDLGGFDDDGDIADYAKAAVYSLAKMGIVNGVGGNMFAPFDTATRAMAAKVIYGMLGGLK